MTRKEAKFVRELIPLIISPLPPKLLQLNQNVSFSTIIGKLCYITFLLDIKMDFTTVKDVKHLRKIIAEFNYGMTETYVFCAVSMTSMKQVATIMQRRITIDNILADLKTV